MAGMKDKVDREKIDEFMNEFQKNISPHLVALKKDHSIDARSRFMVFVIGRVAFDLEILPEEYIKYAKYCYGEYLN